MSRHPDFRSMYAHHVATMPLPDCVPGGRGVVLRTGVRFYSLPGGRDFDNGFLAYDGRTGIIECRHGYSWDRVSIPKWVFWLDKTDKTLAPGLAHDAPYQLGREGVFDLIPEARYYIDGYFYHNLVAWKNGKAKAWQMYYGVRIGGASSFRK